MCKIKLVYPGDPETRSDVITVCSHLTGDKRPLHTIEAIANAEVRFSGNLEIFRPYVVLHVERIAIGPHSCSVVTLREGPDVNTEILIPINIMSKEEEFNIKVRLLTALLVNVGRDAE